MCKNFIEVYVSTDLETCMKRDVRNQYQKAIAGEIKDFTGISAPYFPPEKPELVIDNGTKTVRECTKIIFDYYRKHG
jgi:adenylylsulfate kinase-like enzyme